MMMEIDYSWRNVLETLDNKEKIALAEMLQSLRVRYCDDCNTLSIGDRVVCPGCHSIRLMHILPGTRWLPSYLRLKVKE